MIRKKMEEFSSPIRWYDGMPMGPQHLQDSHSRLEELMRFRLSVLNPYEYGVIKLKIDVERLKYNVFKIDELECIMPDGLEINYLYGIDHKLELELSQFREKMPQESCATVFLCVPYGKQIGHTESKFTRFLAVPTDIVNDMNSGGESIGIPRYRANTSLQIGLIPPAEYMSIPIASINLDTKSFELNSYTPPSIILKKGDEVFKMCENILNVLNLKLDHLVDQYTKTYFDPKKPENMLGQLINMIRQAIPKFALTLEQPYIKPYTLYSEVVSLYGSVICLDSSFVKETIPSYNHDNIFDVFSKISKIIIDKLEYELPKDFLLLYFEKNKEHFSFKIIDINNTNELLIGFRKNKFFSEEELISFINNLLICESSKFLYLKESRSLGFNRSQIHSKEGLFLNKNILLFKVDVKNEHIDKGSEIIIFSNSNKFEHFEKNSIIFYNKTN